MKRYLILASLAAMLLGSIRMAAAQQPTAATPNTTRYSGVASVPQTRAAAVPMRVEVKDWYLVRAATPFQVPAQGFYVAQLRSGRIATEISGKTVKRLAGDFWTVDAGLPMSITMAPHGESAQLRTIAVNPGP